MRRVENPVVWLSLLLGAAIAGFTTQVRAQGCEGARPTDPGGSQGVSYGSAEVGSFDAPSGRARIHYALSGAQVPPPASSRDDGVPDVVAVAAQAADDALDKYESLGYRAPLSDADSPCASNGDSDALDIYLVNFSAADGQTNFDNCQPGPPKRCAGFVLVENDFKGGSYADTAEGLRTVVPHELFHLVQDAYDADVKRWWAEGSAQWAAKQVYPELLDLERFLPDYFKAPSRPLDTPPSGPVAGFLYATAIWPEFLSERFDAEVVREVYDGLDQDSGILPTTDAVLTARGSSLAEEFLQFAAYNAATGKRAPDSGGYRTASDYPEVALTELPSAQGDLVKDIGSGLGAFYYSLSASTPSELALDADPTRMAAVLLPLVDGKPQLEDQKPLPATLNGEGVVVVAGQSTLHTDAPFALLGRAPGATSGGAGDGVKASGCALVATPPRKSAGFGGAALGFVVILLRRRRTRPRTAKESPACG